MAAGSLRERLRFQSPVSLDEGYGTIGDGWTEEFSVAAEIRPLKGGEAVQAARLAGTQPVIIRVRRSTETLRIAADWQAIDARSEGRIYQIKSPPADMDQKRMYLDMLAETGVAA